MKKRQLLLSFFLLSTLLLTACGENPAYTDGQNLGQALDKRVSEPALHVEKHVISKDSVHEKDLTQDLPEKEIQNNETTAESLEPEKASSEEYVFSANDELTLEAAERQVLFAESVEAEIVGEDAEDHPKQEEKVEPITKKTNEEIAKEVLNGKWGNGDSRKAKLLEAGYNYDEVQKIVTELAPAPESNIQVSKESPASSSSSTPNSVLIGGTVLPITNTNTQSRLDARYMEFVNWGSHHVAYKTHGDGLSLYLAVHRDSYGGLVAGANQLTYTDINGSTKTYYLSSVHGPFTYSEYAYAGDIRYEGLSGNGGDAVYIQTCTTDGDGSHYVYIFK